MGIPIGWNIKKDDPKEKDVLRADVTGQRSPIRRRIRSTRSPTSPSALDADFLVSTSRYHSHLDFASSSSQARTRRAPPPVPELSRTDDRNNEPSRNPPSLQRDESSLRRSRNRLDGYMRAYEARASLGSDRPLPALTPGFAPAAASRPDIVREARESIRNMYRRDRDPRLTRSRSPRAYPSTGRNNEPEVEEESSDHNAVSFPPLRRMGRRTIADGPLPSSSLRESWSPVSTLDGLGDRQRSASPFDEQLHWDTFLTTVVPDPVGPTAESSFASAAASASFSNSHPSSRAGSSNSAASSRTHITVPSRRYSPQQNEQFMRACDTSEDDTASDTEEEDINISGSMRRLRRLRTATEAIRNELHRSEAIRSELNELNRSDPAPSRRRIRPSYFSNEPPLRETERYSRRVLERSRDATAFVRNYYNASTSQNTETQADRPRTDQLDGPTEGYYSFSGGDEPPPLEPVPLDQELRDARSLLERLSRREDISDDFWASVGLTRSFADPVERFQERERS